MDEKNPDLESNKVTCALEVGPSLNAELEQAVIVEKAVDASNPEFEIDMQRGDTISAMAENEKLLAEISDTVEGQLAKYDVKKKELELIQTDLNELMDRLNTFISDSQDDVSSSSECGDDNNNNNNNAEITDSHEEKQDGQEKVQATQISMDEMYVTDGTNPPEINWDTLAPFIQNIVGDLKKLRNLNNMTNNVVRRIRNVTESNATILDEENNVNESANIMDEGAVQLT